MQDLREKLFSHIGRPVIRKEDGRLLTGRGRFTDDFSLPRQAHAVMVRSPYAHARILGIDASAALAASAAAASPLPEAGFQKRRGGILGFVASLKAVPAELIPDEEASAAAGAPQVPQALRDAVDYALSVARDRRAELGEAALAAKEAALALEASDSLAERRRLYGIEELASALVAQQEAILLSSRELERAVPRPREPFTAHLAPEEA